jgi:phosphoribosylformimino-5-aminoimidazole carboxamide ribonucleotide (ProFAR) isomerase
VIVTAIERDGMLTGPDLDGLRAVLAMTEIPVIASGGVKDVSDVAALARLAVGCRPDGGADGSPVRRLSGVVTGKAVVEGRMTVGEGVAACAPSG